MVRPAAILDIDGTLVDTNYHHALAWYRSFRRHDVVLPVWRIHRHIGVGGDQIVRRLCGERVESERGDAIREAEKDLYAELIGEVEAFPDARRVIDQLRARGHPVVLASSAKAEEVDHYLDMLDARELVQGWTAAADVDKTKPEPDLVLAGMEKAGKAGKAGGGEAVMVGDSTWDIESARRAGIPTIAVLTGGYSAAELQDAGAVAVFESLVALCEGLDRTPLGGAVRA
jgi:HAD superfamily hydrolase (TIGR01509 family)